MIEVVISIALLSIIGVAFLSALSSSTNGVRVLNERETAKNLAEHQLEYVKSLPYGTSYSSGPIPPGYDGFSVKGNQFVVTSNLTNRDANLQEVAVTIQHNGKDVITVEGYKECPKTAGGSSGG